MPKFSDEEKEFYKLVGDRMYTLRSTGKRKSISQTQLARSIGVKPTIVFSW